MASFLDNASDWLGRYVVPIAERYVQGATQSPAYSTGTAGDAMQREKDRLNRLNGSGAVSGAQAATAPQTLWDYIVGKKVRADTGEVTFSPWPLFIGAGLLAFFLWRRR